MDSSGEQLLSYGDEVIEIGWNLLRCIMSAFGTKRTFVCAAVMSAFGGKADLVRVLSTRLLTA